MVVKKRSRTGLFLLLSALVIATVGESSSDLALNNSALNTSSSVITVGWIFFVGYVVEAAFGFLIGHRVDRFGAGRSYIAACGVRITLFAILALLSTLVSFSAVTIIVAAAGVDLVVQAVDVAQTAVLPSIVSEDTLVKISGLAAAARSITEFVAPVISGYVISNGPNLRSFWFTALLYAISIVLVLVGAHILRADPTRGGRSAEAGETDEDTPPADSESARYGARQTLSEIVGHRSWRRLVLLDALTTVFLSTAVLFFFTYFRTSLKLPVEGSAALLSAVSVGTFAGALFVSRMKKDGVVASMKWAASSSGVGLGLVCLGRGELVLTALGLIIFGIGFMVHLRSAVLVIQMNAPTGRLGGWYSIIDGLERIGCATAALASGYLWNLVSGTTIMAVCSIGLLLSGIYWYLQANKLDFSTP